MKPQSKLEHQVGIVMAVISLTVGGFGEIYQRLVQRGILEYQISFGYISDVCAVPFTTGLMVAITGKLKWYYPVGYAICFRCSNLRAFSMRSIFSPIG